MSMSWGSKNVGVAPPQPPSCSRRSLPPHFGFGRRHSRRFSRSTQHEREQGIGTAAFAGFIGGAIVGGPIGAILGACGAGTIVSIAYDNARRRGMPEATGRTLTSQDEAFVATGAALAAEAGDSTGGVPNDTAATEGLAESVVDPAGWTGAFGSGNDGATAGAANSSGGESSATGVGAAGDDGAFGGSSIYYDVAATAAVATDSALDFGGSDSGGGGGDSGGGGGDSSSHSAEALPTAIAVASPAIICPIMPRSDASGNFLPDPAASSDWVVAPFKAEADIIFSAYVGAAPTPRAAATTAAAAAAETADASLSGSGSNGAGGVFGGASLAADVAREPLSSSGLPRSALRRVWDLSDVDRDGRLDEWEFAVALYLCRQYQESGKLPRHLPENVIPPCKRGASSPSNPFV